MRLFAEVRRANQGSVSTLSAGRLLVRLGQDFAVAAIPVALVAILLLVSKFELGVVIFAGLFSLYAILIVFAGLVLCAEDVRELFRRLLRKR